MRRAAARTFPASPAHQAATGLVKLGLALRHHAWKEGKGEGLTPTQGQLLSSLMLQEDPRRRTPGQLSRELALSPATVTEALNALEAKGLVVRRVVQEDRRSVRIDLTEQGLSAARDATGWADFLAAAVGSLPPADQVALVRVLIHIIRTLQQRGQIPVARMCVNCRFFRPYAHPDPQRPHHCDYVDAPFGDAGLRLDCPEHQPAAADMESLLWQRWAGQAYGAAPSKAQGGSVS